MDLDETFRQAADMVKDLPSALQPVAFQITVDELLRGRNRGGRRKRSSSSNNRRDKQATTRATGRRTSRVGGQSALRELAEGDFFRSPRTLKQILDHLRTRKALTLRSRDLTSPLVTLTREGVLEREQNEDGVFEYRLPGRA